MQDVSEQIQRGFSVEWMILPLLFVLISYALIRYLKVGIIWTSIRQYFSFSLVNQSFHDVGGQSVRLTTALMLNSFIIASILLYKILSPLFSLNIASFYFIILGCILIWFAIKKLTVNLIGNITEASEILNKAQIYSGLYYQIIGVLLLPGVIAMLFFPSSSNVIFSYFSEESINIGYVYSGFVFIALYIVKLFQTISQSFSVKISWSYIILYLCTLEILPLVVIYRLLVGRIWMFN